MFWVYILRCSDTSLYTGCTNDLQKRLTEHNFSKRGAKYTKTRRLVELIYSEKCKTLSKARHREAEIKNWPRKKKLTLMQKTGLT